MDNKAISAQDSAIFVSTTEMTSFDPADYTEVDGVSTFPFGPGQANTLDATNLRSTELENIPGLSGGQSVQVSGHRWPIGDSPGQDILMEAAQTDDLWFLMVLPSGDKATFVAKVAAFNVAPGVNAVLTFTADVLPRNFQLEATASSSP
jgi:hypothetical protein